MSNVDEMWGTFSVDDHLRRRAFVAEMVLYDRLVVPVPPTDDGEELRAWRDRGWEPERAKETVDLLEGAIYPSDCVGVVTNESSVRSILALTGWHDKVAP